LKRIPGSWTHSYLPEAIEKELDLSDAWEFRRLLELLDEVAPSISSHYARDGLQKGGELEEAARDWLEALEEKG